MPSFDIIIWVIFMIVFFDLDGTLISDDEAYIIPESAINARLCARKY